jgi:hypothetical protein
MVGCEQEQKSKNFFVSYIVAKEGWSNAYTIGVLNIESYESLENMIVDEWLCEGREITPKDITIMGIYRFDNAKDYNTFFGKTGTPPCIKQTKQ